MTGFPFSAIVGQEQLRRALLICAINPAIGGVVVRGDKGTAKSTAARALAEILPPIKRRVGCSYNCDLDNPAAVCDTCNEGVELETVQVPFINLPIGATEDRVIGSLDFERALKEGRRAFQPGLLASAHRGIVYIDEVNLLPDHIVDVLLDVAAMGVNTIQREGLSITHPSKIALIGTMNLEEGDLRPQLLDRFAMLVEVRAPMDVSTRSEVVKRRLEFETNPETFTQRWQSSQDQLRDTIRRAQALLHKVRLNDAWLEFISTICCEFNVTSLRADIVMHKVARTLAAIDDRTEVVAADIRAAAELVLPHRMRKRPGDASFIDQQKLDDLLKDAPDAEKNSGQELSDNMESSVKDQPSPGNSRSQELPGESADGDDNEGAHGPGEVVPGEFEPGEPEPCEPESGSEHSSRSARSVEQIFAPAKLESVAKIELKSRNTQQDTFGSGRRSSVQGAHNGRFVRALASATPQSIAIEATIKHSVVRNAGKLSVSRQDFHEKIRQSKTGSAILFVVDASGSMAALKRMEAVKGAVMALLDDIYQKRDEVGVIAFRGDSAELVVPMTRSIEVASLKMRELKTGGRTPLSHALDLALNVLQSPNLSVSRKPLLVVLTDGKTNVGQSKASDPWLDAIQCAQTIADRNISALVLDTESGYIKFGRAKQLAESMNATYLLIDDLSAQGLTLMIRSHLKQRIRQ